uniref:Secreted protein n=1 Tax=Achlya hypogyna TaxID=1202772 RepID=A0A0A7CN84_ACHHY|nr:secreted protein [Achlya hypogyna]
MVRVGPSVLLCLAAVASATKDATFVTDSADAAGLLHQANTLRHVDSANASALYAQVASMSNITAAGDALFALGDLAFPDPSARLFFKQSAALGRPHAQHMLAALTAIGIGSPPAVASAVIYDHFAALGGDSRAAQALGYRALYGLGSPRSCAVALKYYKHRAATVVAESASMAPGLWRKPVSLVNQAVTDPDTDFHKLVYVAAAAASARDGRALYRAATRYLTLMGPVDSSEYVTPRAWLEEALVCGEAAAAAYLGHFYAFGWGVPIDYSRAHALYTVAIDIKGGEALNGLGLLHLHGRGVPQNEDVALDHFDKAALQGHADAMYHVGAILGARKQESLSARYLQAATSSGHALATFAYAQVVEKTSVHPFPRTCDIVVPLYKRVAEARGHPLFDRAVAAFHRGDYAEAHLMYRIVAEEGYLVAQTNALWLQHEGYVSYKAQGSGYAQLLLADAHYNRGDYRMALAAYTVIATSTQTQWKTPGAYKIVAPAAFRLGYMHEMGLGTPASRSSALQFYARAIEVERRFKLPIELWTWKWALLDFFAVLTAHQSENL